MYKDRLCRLQTFFTLKVNSLISSLCICRLSVQKFCAVNQSIYNKIRFLESLINYHFQSIQILAFCTLLPVCPSVLRILVMIVRYLKHFQHKLVILCICIDCFTKTCAIFSKSVRERPFVCPIETVLMLDIKSTSFIGNVLNIRNAVLWIFSSLFSSVCICLKLKSCYFSNKINFENMSRFYWKLFSDQFHSGKTSVELQLF